METKTLTVRVPKAVAAKLEKEARERGLSQSDIVRERLTAPRADTKPDPLADIRDLVGCIDDPSRPTDMSSRVDYYLKKTGYGRDRRR
jgi:hypothetical protein